MYKDVEEIKQKIRDVTTIEALVFVIKSAFTGSYSRADLLAEIEDEDLRESLRHAPLVRLQHVANIFRSRQSGLTPRLVRYEWRHTDGERFDKREDGLVGAQVSDWENAEKSMGSGRKIVHVYYVDDGIGNVRPYGKSTALQLLYPGVVEWEAESRMDKEVGLLIEKEAAIRKEIEYAIKTESDASSVIMNAMKHMHSEHLRNEIYKKYGANKDITMSNCFVFFEKEGKYTFIENVDIAKTTEGKRPRKYVILANDIVEKMESLGYKQISFKELRLHRQSSSLAN